MPTTTVFATSSAIVNAIESEVEIEVVTSTVTVVEFALLVQRGKGALFYFHCNLSSHVSVWRV